MRRLLICVLHATISGGLAEAIDAKMHPTYHALAQHLLASSNPERAHWVAIAGGPGSGKSTLAAAVAAIVNEEAGEQCCVVLPMDGFHYSRAQLRELDPPSSASYLPRRGAPWTFDAEGCYKCLAAAKRTNEAVLPTYSRELSDPVPGGARLDKSHRIVLVEGNYLLMREPLGAEEFTAEGARWGVIDEIWDERWFLKCTDAAAQRRRLIRRHLETWNDEKAERWGPGEVGAAARADANDVLNMDIIAPCEAFADRVIESI
jgi:pantothenate kinase